MQQRIVLPMARKRPGERAQQITVELILAAESQTMSPAEIQQCLGRLAQRASSLVQEEFGGEVLPSQTLQKG